LLVNIAASTVYVWHGAKSLKHTRQVATAAANALQQNRPPELFTSFSNSSSPAAIAIKEQFEGAESRDFWEGIGHGSRIADRSAYHCLADSSARYDYTPRLYHLTSWSGTFRAEEVAPSCRHPSNPCAYPFLQVCLFSFLSFNALFKLVNRLSSQLLIIGGYLRGKSTDPLSARRSGSGVVVAGFLA
jgi:supervillin